ncbi:extracellular solute-binding protein [Paenibacillus psychroresistens]|uniref:Extracellular solute-binding protein n=1 Tax=Paenibacillus psychroresistens TaxID=1778678 RepID=A0A6B8RRK3_9BACL|nr:extracellular solute-binding protein [Paenibacillus psychroresistens]QGQ98175.1 extracellular solute-binding protein [Paenibacillus psychroresistens]
MTKSSKKFFNVTMAFTLAITLLAGCSSSKTSEPTAAPDAAATAAPAVDATKAPEATKAPDATDIPKAGLDISKKVELQFYMLGDAPKDLAIIQDKVNEMALKDLNATVKFNYTTWTDWDQKYKLLLSSGQPVDLIFTAEWAQFQQYANKGAFIELNEMLPVAAPKLYSFVPQDMWDAIKINGKIFTMPATFKEYVTTGFVYRDDLREKYNLPVPTSLETFEAYLEGIKKNVPTLTPLGVNSNVRESISDTVKNITDDPVGGPLPYGVGIKYKTPSEVTSYWGSEENLADLKLFKRWADKGFWSKNILNLKDTDLLVNGKAAALIGDNPNRFNDQKLRMTAGHPDWKLAYYPAPYIKGHAEPVHPMHNAFAVPKSSKNPERAIAFYEKLVTDKNYNLLTQYGIEGVNYTVEDGYYKMIGDATSNGFPREAMNSWAWRNPEYMLFDKGFDGVKEIFKKLDEIKQPDIFTGFAEDYSSYQAERAALEQVEKQYMYPLIAGLVPDVEKGLKTFMEKAKAAGLDKVQEEYKKQWLAYLQSAGIK